MIIELLPVWAVFACTIIVVLLAIEAGFRMGRTVQRRSKEEKETSVSSIAASILGLLAFMMVFTFGIVSNKYDSRRALVSEEANAIGTAYLRSDFLPEAERAKAAKLFMEYVSKRVGVQQADLGSISKLVLEAEEIQDQLWDMAAANALRGEHPAAASLYVNALNQMIDIHALRVTVGLQTRIPHGFWLILNALLVLSMLAVGYQAGIAGSRRSLAMPVLAVAFSLVITLIASMDDPYSRFITVSQKPMENLLSSMARGSEAPADIGTNRR